MILPKHMRISAAAMLRMYMLVVVLMWDLPNTATITSRFPITPTKKINRYAMLYISCTVKEKMYACSIPSQGNLERNFGYWFQL